jgi:hypothetical protein
VKKVENDNRRTLQTVIPTGASHSRKEWEAEWRDPLFYRVTSDLAAKTE